MWVVKLGGSLASSARLRDWLGVLALYGGRAVVVPGGGPFADAVRQVQETLDFSDATAHHMALLAMGQYGLMLADLEAELVPVDSIAGIEAALQSGRTPVWLPAAMVSQEPTIEASWRVTSDSLALWLAGRLKASLALIKSVPATPAGITVGDLIRHDIVDPAFGDYARRANCEIFCLGPDDHPSLALALRDGLSPGTRVTL